MKRFVVDASVAIKWVFEEDESDAALELANNASLIAPDLLVCECANIIWKKVRYGEYAAEEAEDAAELIGESTVEFFSMKRLLGRATELAIQLDHPAYDCFYLALAEAEETPLVTADARLAAKLRTLPLPGLSVLTIAQAIA